MAGVFWSWRMALGFSFLYLPIWLFLSIGSGWILVSLATDSGDGTWFQRSGSVLVLLAVFSEFILRKLNRKAWELHIERYPANRSNQIDGYEKLLFGLYSFSQAGIAGSAVLGTIIWGYGDRIYLNYIN